MKKIFLFAAMQFALTVNAQSTLTLQPDAAAGKDAEISNCYISGCQAKNFGNSVENAAVAWTKNASGYNVRSLLQFDLSSLPPSATIQSAVLSLYWAPGCEEGKHYGFFGSNGAFLQRITAPWDEHTVTWNTQPATTELDRAIIHGTSQATQHLTSIPVTQLVKDMVADPEHSFGFQLIMQNESAFKKLVFASSDYPNAALHPKLVITYTSNESVSSSTTLPDAGDMEVVRVFPNPAKETVNISIHSSSDDAGFISIYDLRGREMTDQSYQLMEGKNQFSFQTASWPRGLYMVIVKSGGEMITEKLVLE